MRPGQRLLCPELIGREADLEGIHRALEGSRAGRGRTVLVAGDAGLGKSALLRKFLETLQASDALVLPGQCIEIDARRPFAPFADVVRAAIRKAPDRILHAALRSDLASLVPELGARVAPPAGFALTDDRARPDERMRDAFLSFLVHLARYAPLVVAIDDLQWADEASLELLPFLARKVGTHRILLLGTYRSDELDRKHPLRSVVAELERARVAEVVRLAPLTFTQTGAMLRRTLGSGVPLPSAVREAVHQRCEGNPLFVEEVLQELADRGQLQRSADGWEIASQVRDLAIPASIREAVQQRVARLTPAVRSTLHVAAAIGQRFSFDLLSRVAAVPEAEMFELLHAAVDAQLVAEAPEAPE